VAVLNRIQADERWGNPTFVVVSVDGIFINVPKGVNVRSMAGTFRMGLGCDLAVVRLASVSRSFGGSVHAGRSITVTPASRGRWRK
jgi:hypothetical protein